MLLDVHTHHLPADPGMAILNQTFDEPIIPEAHYLSLSVHPWSLTITNLPHQLRWVKSHLSDPRVIALGETGLDKLCAVPLPLQERAFRAMASISEQHRLPLILHVVKCAAEIIALKKELHPSMPWIIHGFRGKVELAQTYLRQGFYLSFGERYQDAALQFVPSSRFLLETDENTVDISELYKRAARLRNLSPDLLVQGVTSTLSTLFFQ